jgi:hypothetical protein
VHDVPLLARVDEHLAHGRDTGVERVGADRRAVELRAAPLERRVVEQRSAPAPARRISVAVPEAVAVRGGDIRLAEPVERPEERREDRSHPALVEIVERTSVHTLGDPIRTGRRVSDLQHVRYAQAGCRPALRKAVLLEVVASLVESHHEVARGLTEREGGRPEAATQRDHAARVVTECP